MHFQALHPPDRYSKRLLTAAIIFGVLMLAFLVGLSPSPIWLGLLAAGIGGGVLLARPVLGLPVFVLAALMVQLEIGTGTEVKLNAAFLLVPVLLALWLLGLYGRGRAQISVSPADRPLVLFLAANLLSLLIGRATWDSTVPVGDSFLLVQLAQWAIFAFSAGAFWLTGNLIKDERWLWRLTVFFLLVGGGLAVLRSLPGVNEIAGRFASHAFFLPAFWMLLTAIAAGQLLYNRALSLPWRVFLVAVLVAGLLFALLEQRKVASNWVALGAVLGALLWLRFPRLRWPIAILLVALLALGVLGRALYEFAGGQAEWDESGGSRLALIGRVLEVTLRNPITGLGPAAYRLYAGMQPLPYRGAYWVAPQINSHNNYVDLFSHGGILGLLFFFWFVWEIIRLGLALRKRYTGGFVAGYVNGILAAGAASLVIMALADWILPFVYNVGFPGFQASVLVWLFMGGLVALKNMPPSRSATGTRWSSTA